MKEEKISSLPRFFSLEKLELDREVTLDESESQHLAKALRKQVGHEVTLFDGTGGEYRATITEVRKKVTTLVCNEYFDINRKNQRRLTIGVALPKGDRQKWLVEKLTELGVSTLVPLLTERGVAQPTGSVLERLTKNVLAACKQSGRNIPMEIQPAQKFNDFLGTVGMTGSRFFAHPGERQIGPTAEGLAGEEEVAWAIGPEGGFSTGEVKEAKFAGWKPVCLGPVIYRIETAALLVACWGQ
ncbi:MAG: 16S rRNA (uracil(1498)-N(3))-methyltransferase [Pirellulaceae bacterium]|nr:16S rRNA (uracil(1498)-N(3))-methyltransferase [Pirellulaceae bacterium]